MGDGGMLTSRDDAMSRSPATVRPAMGCDRVTHHQVDRNQQSARYVPGCRVASQVQTFVTWTPLSNHAASNRTALFRSHAGSDANLVGGDCIKSSCRTVDDSNAFHVWNQYSIRVGANHRDALRSYLAEQGVGSEIYYPIPVHRQACYSHLNVSDDLLPETMRASDEILNLPIFPSLTEAEQTRVVETISGFYAGQGRIAA